MAKNFGEERFSKKKSNLYSVIGKIGDILFYPIIILALLSTVFIYVQKQENKVPSLFGISIACIQSESMLATGFEKGDVVFLHNEKSQDLRAGDIIGFYYKSIGVSKSNLTLVQSYNRETKEMTEYSMPEIKDNKTPTHPSLNDVREQKTSVYFHRIVNIYSDASGNLYFETQGDSNASADVSLIYSEYVVGEYSDTPAWLRDVFSFLASSSGIIAMIIVPLSILILFILFSVIEQISNISTTKRVLRRELRFDTDESIAANVGIEMDELEKISFFANAPPEDRAAVAEFLWSHLEKGNSKDLKKYELIQIAVEKFEKNPKEYWLFWINQANSSRKKKKIERAWRLWDAETNTKANFMAVKNKAAVTKAQTTEGKQN